MKQMFVETSYEVCAMPDARRIAIMDLRRLLWAGVKVRDCAFPPMTAEELQAVLTVLRRLDCDAVDLTLGEE